MAAFYRRTLSGFLEEAPDSIIGRLTSEAASAGFFQQIHAQTAAWQEEIETLKAR